MCWLKVSFNLVFRHIVLCKLIQLKREFSRLDMSSSITQCVMLLLLLSSNIVYTGCKNLLPGTQRTQTEVSSTEELKNDFLKQYLKHYVLTSSLLCTLDWYALQLLRH